MIRPIHHSTTVLMAAIAVLLGTPCVQAAKVAMRLHGDDGQYTGFPDSFPVCKSGMDYMHYDGTPKAPLRDAFNTKTGWIENGVYAVGGQFNGSEVVGRLRTYEDNGMDVAGVSLYREDWLATDTPGGEYPEDYRILSTTEITAVRNAIATASPPLRCKNTLKIIQLLGAGSGAWGAGSAGDFPTLSAEVKEHLKLFDGVGVECHVGDHLSGARRRVIVAMAAVARWAQDNGKTTFVFMGGGASSYENLPVTQRTYQYLWSEMLLVGIDYRADNIIYFRQGAWPDGKHTPESAFDTLTHQQRWVIQSLAPGGTSLYVTDVRDQATRTGQALTVPFGVGKAELTPDRLVVTAVSSNQALLPNANIRLSGRGFDRAVTLTPMPLQTGVTTITLSVNDGITSKDSAFQFTVTPAETFTAVASGPINDAATWGMAAPVAGDPNLWRTGARTLNLTDIATATFYGDSLEVQTGGQLTPANAGANLTLQRLVLNGGTISMANNLIFDLDLSGRPFLLMGGTLKSGSSPGMGVRIKNGSLAGSGTINITSAGTAGAEVEFQDSIVTLGFSGVFNVSSNGYLNLPPVPVDNASFGMNLSGTGKYVNDAEVALTSLVIAGQNIAPGVYTYAAFTPAQQAYLLDNGGTLTVLPPNIPPVAGVVADQVTDEDIPVTISFSASDAQTAADLLTYRGFSSNPALVANGEWAFGGSGNNRTLTLTPVANQSGTAVITLSVGDDWFTTTRTFVLTVNAVNDPPTLSEVGSQSVSEGAPITIPFTIGDAETAADALIVSVSSSNTELVPNESIAITGSGAERNIQLTAALLQNGDTTLTLDVSDGVLTTTRSFVLSVTPLNAVIALMSGKINDAATWGGAAPVAGDAGSWRTGAYTLNMASATEVFWGRSLVLQTGGRLSPGLPTANLTLNNLVLQGGTISTGNNNGINLDLSGQSLVLNSGTLNAGGANTGRDVRFKNGALAGNGMIAITASSYLSEAPPDVEFQSTVTTQGFTGAFDVRNNGVLNLSTIPLVDASFGLVLSGSGRYANDAEVALRWLVIDGTSVPAGTYQFADFSPAQQAFLLNSGGTLTVNSINHPPTLSALTDLTTPPGLATAAVPVTIGDVETPAAALSVRATSSNPLLVADAHIVPGGSGAERTLTVTPAAGLLGSATITVTVGDGVMSTSGSFVLTISGTPDETWRFAQFGTTLDAAAAADSANPDHDAWTNAQEYVLGTRPQSPDHAPLLAPAGDESNITLAFTALAATGPGYDGLTRLYDVETTRDLADPASWTGLPGYTAIPGANQTLTVTQPLSDGPRFYRLKVRLQP